MCQAARCFPTGEDAGLWNSQISGLGMSVLHLTVAELKKGLATSQGRAFLQAVDQLSIRVSGLHVALSCLRDRSCSMQLLGVWGCARVCVGVIHPQGTERRHTPRGNHQGWISVDHGREVSL